MSYCKPKSCCCLSLREGTIFLLLIALIFNVIAMLIYLFLPENITKINNISESERRVLIGSSAIGIFFDVIGLIGVIIRKANVLLIFICYYVLEFGLNVTINVLGLFASKDGKSFIASLIGLIIGMLISIYFILVFKEYAYELRREEKEDNEIAAAAAKV